MALPISVGLCHVSGGLAETPVPAQLWSPHLTLQQASLCLLSTAMSGEHEGESENVEALFQTFVCVIFVNILLTTVGLVVAEPE